MSDDDRTLDVDEAFAKADEQLNNEDQEDETTDDEVEETEDESEDETTEESEDETEDNQESFTKKFNPDDLPDELRGVYKSLQADYTRKTQELANERKKTASELESLKKQLSELQKPNEEVEKKSPQEELQDFIDRRIEQTGEAKRIADFRETAIKDYEQSDDRLRLNSDTYDKPTDLYVGQEMDNRLREHIESGEPEYTFDYKTHLKEVLSEWDEYVQKQQKAFLEKQSKKAKEKAKQVTKQNPKGKSGPGRPKKMSLDEAIVAASQKA